MYWVGSREFRAKSSFKATLQSTFSWQDTRILPCFIVSPLTDLPASCLDSNLQPRNACHSCPMSVTETSRLKLSREANRLKLKSLLPSASIHSFANFCWALLLGQRARQWEAKMKCIVYGGETGTEDDNAGSQCPKTRREVMGKVRVIISILGYQREATSKWFQKQVFKRWILVWRASWGRRSRLKRQKVV